MDTILENVKSMKTDEIINQLKELIKTRQSLLGRIFQLKQELNHRLEGTKVITNELSERS